MADRCRLHLDKCSGESRAIPDQSSSHWSRLAVCDHDFDIRRAGRVHRIVVQVNRPRNVVLLLPLVGDRDYAHRLYHDARHQAILRPRSSRLEGSADGWSCCRFFNLREFAIALRALESAGKFGAESGRWFASGFATGGDTEDKEAAGKCGAR